MNINKKITTVFAFILTTVILITIMSASMITVNATILEFAGGSGTENDPYLIETKYHLNNVRNYQNAYFKMNANIVFSKICCNFCSNRVPANNSHN